VKHVPLPHDLTGLLEIIQASNAGQLQSDRWTQRTGPFLVALHPTSEMVWINYATPVEPTSAEALTSSLMADLRAIFHAHRRIPRFEFIETLHPLLANWLEAHGLTLQLRAPLMVCGKGDLKPCFAPGMTIHEIRADADQALLAEFIRVTRRSFATAPIEPSAADLIEQRELLSSGRQRLCHAAFEGRMVACGVMQASAELGGVATLPEFRRRGAAAAVSTQLVLRHFSEGGQVVWLSAGDEAAHRLYAKIGFREAGAVLNYIEPS